MQNFIPTFKRTTFRPLYKENFIVGFQKDRQIPNDFLPNYPYIYRALSFRNKIDMNTFVVIVGAPRSGKSACAIKIAEEYCKINNVEFNIENQLTFNNVKKFLNWSIDTTNSIFILDETGTSLSTDVWYSLASRIMRRFVQTQGFRKNILLWVLPSVIFLQKKFSFMSNYAIKTIRQGVVSTYKIIFDHLYAKGFPEWVGERMTFKLPESEIWDKYLDMKLKWNDEELKNDINFLDDLDKEYKRKFPYSMYLDAFQSNIINKEQLKQHLTELNFKNEDIDLIINHQICQSNKKDYQEDIYDTLVKQDKIF